MTLTTPVQTERSLPHDVEVEKSILGAVLLDNHAFTLAAQSLAADDFFGEANRFIYEAMAGLFERGEAIDPVTLRAELDRRDALQRSGGPAYISSLIDGLPSAVNIEQYARIVKDKAALRRLITASNTIIREAMQGSADTDELLDRAEHAIFEISESKIRRGFLSVRDVAFDAMRQIEELMERGDYVTGVPTGFSRLDAMTAGWQPGDLIILAARPSMGKCLAADAEIVLEDGSIATIEQVVERRAGPVSTLREDMKLGWAQPSAYVDDGVKPVFEVQTRLGRKVTTTLTHPFLTIDGWQPLERLEVGDKVAVPRRLEAFGNGELRPYEVKLLAYLIGDGCLTRPCPQFTSSNPRIADDFAEAVAEFGGLSMRSQGVAARPVATQVGVAAAPVAHWRQAGTSPEPAHALALCEVLEVEPEMPGVVFTLRRDLLALFLNRLFATDGWATVLKSGQAQLGYSTVSEGLARQVQHLLLRFGVIASLRQRWVRYSDARRVSWQLDITDSRAIRAFAEAIGIFGKEQELEAVVRAVSGRPRLVEPTHGDVYWDEITSIRALGPRQVYDLTVPGTHNFVANDVCVHNTALALNMAQHVALNAGGTVGFFSLEMSVQQVVRRLVTATAMVDAHKLATGFLSNKDKDKLLDSLHKLAETKIFIDDTAAMTILEMRAKARRLKAEHGLDLLVIDYLQLVRGSARAENRNLEIGEISRSTKALAKELQVPILALSQLSRAPESRSGHRPQLSDLRESGNLEQDADVVAFIFRPEVYSDDPELEGVAELILSKQRNGPIGMVPLAFLKPFTLFKDRAETDEAWGG